jgi:uncharacterized membrane protein YjfL (UPF0719 family)
MDDSNFLIIGAGLLAYCVAVTLGTGPLAYAAYWLDKTLTKKADEDKLLHDGNRSAGLELGTTLLCQAILVRHAVYAAMAVFRSLFVESLTLGAATAVILRSVLCIVIIASLGFGSVQIAGAIFKKFIRRRIDIADAIRVQDNLAVAIFYSLTLLAITLVLNEGIEDFSRSLIPFGRAGLVNLP